MNVVERYVNFFDNSFGEHVEFVENTKKKTNLEVFRALFVFISSYSIFFSQNEYFFSRTNIQSKKFWWKINTSTKWTKFIIMVCGNELHSAEIDTKTNNKELSYTDSTLKLYRSDTQMQSLFRWNDPKRTQMPALLTFRIATKTPRGPKRTQKAFSPLIEPVECGPCE